MGYNFRILAILLILFFVAGISYAQQIPTGVAIDLITILNITKSIGGFLIALGSVLAFIAIAISGFTYFFAGSDQSKVKMAKDILKAGIIGAFILFSSGIIVKTIENFATNPFQFFGGGRACNSGVRVGQSCATNMDCPNFQPGTCGGAGQPLCSYSLCL